MSGFLWGGGATLVHKKREIVNSSLLRHRQAHHVRKDAAEIMARAAGLASVVLLGKALVARRCGASPLVLHLPLIRTVARQAIPVVLVGMKGRLGGGVARGASRALDYGAPRLVANGALKLHPVIRPRSTIQPNRLGLNLPWTALQEPTTFRSRGARFSTRQRQRCRPSALGSCWRESCLFGKPA